MDPKLLALLMRLGYLETTFACESVALQQYLHQVRGTVITEQAAAGDSSRIQPMDPTTVIDGVAVIDLLGVMSKATSFWRLYGLGNATTIEVRDAIDRAAANAQIRAIVLRIDSPGGSVAGTADLASAVANARAVKPVLAFIEDMGASAAYWTASQAQEIYAGQTAKVGSIGTYAVIPDYSQMAANEGIKIHVIRAGTFKGAAEPGTVVTDAQLADFQRVIDQTNELFLAGVARGRGISLAKVKELNDGRVHVGKHAQALGLIDGVSTLGAVIDRARSLAGKSSSSTRISNSSGGMVSSVASVSRSGEHVMNRKLFALLATMGLAVSASDAEATAFLQSLQGENKAKADALVKELEREAAAASAAGATPPVQTPVTPTAPSAEPVASAQPTPTGDLVRQGIEAERRRTIALRNTAAQVGLPDAVLQQHIDQGTSPEQFAQIALAHVGANRRPVSVTGGEDGRASLVAGMIDGLAARMGIRVENPAARANEIAYLPILEVGRMWLNQLGISTAGMAPITIAQMLCDRQTVWGRIGDRAAMHSTSDFPAILGNTLNKVLLPGYTEEPSTWEAWAESDTVDNFLDQENVQLGMIASPPEVKEGAEYTYATVGERSEIYRVVKHGVLAALTWEMLVNDRLNAFKAQALGFGPASKRLENDLAYGRLLANPTMREDNTALFHADHNNLFASGDAGAPSQTTLDKMRTAMALQRGIRPKPGVLGPVLNLRLAVVLVPNTLATLTEILINSTTQIASSQNNANVPNARFIRNLIPVSDSRLDANSTTAWYGIAQRTPGLRTAVVAKLRGNESPYIAEIQTGSSIDGVTFKMRHVVGAAITDWRGIAKNNG